jgi:hypothetical protein
MRQFVLVSLFVIALLAGGFAYFGPSQNSVSPIKFLMDSVGISSEDSSNSNKIQQMDVSRSNDLSQTRQKMDDLDQKLEQERQKAQDQQLISQQRIEDQKQRIQDQQNR